MIRGDNKKMQSPLAPFTKGGSRGISAGFSLIEILVVIAIMGILGGIVMTGFLNAANKNVLDKQTAVVNSYINEARNNAVASLGNSEHGIKVSTSSIVRFTGTNYSAGASSNVTHTLPSGISITSSFPSGVFYFYRISGEPSVTGTITLSQSKNGTSTKVILIKGTGLSEIQ